MEDKNKLRLLAAVVLIVLVVDQSVKFWIKTNLSIGEELYPLGVDWAVIHFVENPGMAFGLTFGGEYGKLALSLFRIIAVILLGFYLRWLYQECVASILLAGFGLILAGALGNIIDSAFYGLIFSESTYHGNPAILFPPDGGYAGFLHGKVVDMLYFPIAEGYFPDWFPLWSGEPYQFFRPVFNVAGIPIYRQPISKTIFNKTFFIGHGDGLGPGDQGYKMIKSIFNNSACQWAFYDSSERRIIGNEVF